MFQLDFFNEITNKLLNNLKEELDGKQYSLLYKSLIEVYPDFVFYHYEEQIKIDEFINLSAKINEKCQSRKDLGKYYTPQDVCDFMLSEIINNNISEQNSIIDPTCGNSEFLVRYIEYVVNSAKLFSNSKLEVLSSNLYGNDNNPIAIQISKVRIFFKIIFYSKDLSNFNFKSLTDNLNKNFTIFDAVTELHKIKVNFDLVIGNPPYVETKNRYKNIKNHGNLYANILENSLCLLKDNGKLAFIIPISYVSTQRMSNIRREVNSQTAWLKLYNFADRPSCLFTSVHQKLSILICGKDKLVEQNKIYSSSYIFWYKNEREDIFNRLSTIEVECFNKFIPKIGNEIEKSIFNKVYTKKTDASIHFYMNNACFNDASNIYLNMRATFWIKCFLDFSRSKEYKVFTPNKEHRKFLYCILNSSLFFWFWCVVSDGWHITAKELDSFIFIEPKDFIVYNDLADSLVKDLEINKRLVNTKQIDFIYQHKESKILIDKIDDELAKLYKLTKKELEFIKSYACKYRMSLGE